MFAEFVVARQRQSDQADRDLVLAWSIEAFHRQKRLKPLKALLEKRGAKGKPARQTPQEMRDVLQKLGMKAKPISAEAKQSLKYIKVN